MHPNTQILLDNLRVVLEPAAAGLEFEVSDHTGIWAMSSQLRQGRPTGRIILVCDDELVLAEFAQAAEQAEHSVEPTGLPNTVFVIPLGLSADYPLLCGGCPTAPPGVRARLTGVKSSAGQIRITAEVAVSDNPRVAVGDSASMIIKDPGSGAAGLPAQVHDCNGRIRYRSLIPPRFTRVCGALGPQFRGDF